ncbi:class I SAM-dependent methyltransferase [Actinomycetospora sp. TBRC 11914]|uniref:class I SAM-dependent methyltransferase n=1 Tax=Actinomycetospora sp. TBRC 11914 TaxID=2729387 RepID=UPI00145DF679|nr:class I SAM-dependent methyltransferase [Actinomycetospora sp. TBRC 11914]NMO90939.1 class I SAM-dependent methyltransferase [Actinomycetospora sp. TBRC 11914]
MTTSPHTFDEAYRTGEPPWVIDEPQPAVVELARDGAITGPVLDLGCGVGEHTILLHRLGYEVLGVDAAPAAVERARERARLAGVAADFAVGDAMDPAAFGCFATVLDSALFHVFGADDQARYARALTEVVAPGGQVLVLALSTRGPGFGPQIDDDAVPAAFTGPAWTVEDLRESIYRGRVTHESQAAATGRGLGELVDLPALLARVRRAGADAAG